MTAYLYHVGKTLQRYVIFSCPPTFPAHIFASIHRQKAKKKSYISTPSPSRLFKTLHEVFHTVPHIKQKKEPKIVHKSTSHVPIRGLTINQKSWFITD